MAGDSNSGEIHTDLWVSFGHNRTLSVRRSANKADYTLLLGADMVLNVDGEFRHQLDLDQYLLRNEGANDYSVERLLNNLHQWKFVGATHEYVTSDTARRGKILPNVTVIHHQDGGSRSNK